MKIPEEDTSEEENVIWQSEKEVHHLFAHTSRPLSQQFNITLPLKNNKRTQPSSVTKCNRFSMSVLPTRQQTHFNCWLCGFIVMNPRLRSLDVAAQTSLQNTFIHITALLHTGALWYSRQSGTIIWVPFVSISDPRLKSSITRVKIHTCHATHLRTNTSSIFLPWCVQTTTLHGCMTHTVKMHCNIFEFYFYLSI